MILAALLLPVLLAAAPAGVEDLTASGSDPARAATLVVRARGLDEEAIQGALRPRVGGAAVVLLRHVVSVDPDHTFIDIDLRPPDLTITIILRDGRVFVRRAPAPGGPRDAARLIASMLVAIEGDALAPLPERAASPALVELGGPPARAAAGPLEVPVPARAPAAVVPPSGHARSDMPARPARQPLAPPRRLAWGLGLGGAAILGLGVPDLGFRAGGGDVRLEVRGDRRWLVSLGVRAAGDRSTASSDPGGLAEPFALVRLRIDLGAGLWFRRGRFELRATAAVSVEPWLVAHRGRRVRLGDTVAPAPLLGGHLRLAPAFAVSPRVRLGMFAELAASAAPSGRAIQVLVKDADLFTLGGLESNLGLELRVALGPPKP